MQELRCCITKHNLAQLLCRGQEVSIIFGGKLNPPFEDSGRLFFLLGVLPYGLHGKLPDNYNPDGGEIVKKVCENVEVLLAITKFLWTKFLFFKEVGFHPNKKDINVCVSHPSTIEKLKKAFATPWFLNLNDPNLNWAPGVSVKLELGSNLVKHEHISNAFVIKAADIRQHPKGSKKKSSGLLLWKIVIHTNTETVCESSPFIRGNGGKSCYKYLSRFWLESQGQKSSRKRKQPTPELVRVVKRKNKRNLKVEKEMNFFFFFLKFINGYGMPYSRDE